MSVLTFDRAVRLFRYDEATGKLTWDAQRGRAKAGDCAGARDHKGYVIVRVDGRIYKAHRIVWLMKTGSWPAGEIDHINGVKDDNRFANLRDVTHAENAQNLHRAQRRNRSCGLLGVTFDRFTGRWKAQLQVNGRRYQIGRYDTAEQAHAAYRTAKASITAA